MSPRCLPFATSHIPAVPGETKLFEEDFRVEEIPAYAPSGEGDHVYFGIEKRGITTMRAIRDVARALGVKPRDVGVAGQKDARGVTRQTLSIEHADPRKVEALDLHGVEILWVSRHRNKLRTGHLKGNLFAIKIRGTDPARIGDARDALAFLAERGAPNYFGPQRFGARGDTWLIGRHILAGDHEEAARVICGSAGEDDSGPVLEARRLYDAGDLEASAAVWPRGYGDSARLCRSLARKPGSFERSVMSMDRRLLGIYVSAFQSHLFNEAVEARLSSLGEVLEGDLAWKHDKGVVFEVLDAQAENPRAARGEISPSGPMFGKRMTWPKGRPGEMEREILAGSGLAEDRFPAKGPLRCTGGRRPLRFFPHEPSAEAGEDENGGYVEVRFGLDSGCYATVVLAEIRKDWSGSI